MKRKVPLTKSGRPDKRFAKSTKSYSKKTKKPPSKRLQTRRGKPILSGYSANPSGYILGLIKKRKIIGYYTGYDFDTLISRAKTYSTLSSAKKSRALSIAKNNGYGLRAIKKIIKQNPMPKKNWGKLKEATKRFKAFSGHHPKFIDEKDLKKMGVAFKIGMCDCIGYTTKRDGRVEKYIHEFKKNSRPVLASNYDGKFIALVNGNYKFTERGIVDT